MAQNKIAFANPMNKSHHHNPEIFVLIIEFQENKILKACYIIGYGDTLYRHVILLDMVILCRMV
jgi:hypothetical protein